MRRTDPSIGYSPSNGKKVAISPIFLAQLPFFLLIRYTIRMAKASSSPPPVRFACSSCDAQSPKWQGRCESCGKWGTLVAYDGAIKSGANAPAAAARFGTPEAFSGLQNQPHTPPLPTTIPALDRLFGGGLVPGSVTLVGGEPGIGKSTLLAQLALALASQGKTVLYITGEESPSQVARRFLRLHKQPTLPLPLQFLDSTDAEIIAGTILRHTPTLTIVDSIQSISTAEATGDAGNVTQVRASAATISGAAKRAHASVIFVGQVTKDGDLAGPRLLEHLVDTVCMLEGDRGDELRVLRMVKHRFGATDESALFTMQESGLQELLDPSVRFLQERDAPIAGSAVTATLDGSRVLAGEIQALVNPAGFGIPARRLVGVDQNRAHLLIAVLSRRASCRLGDQDVFLNTVGGLRLHDPATDLAVAAALASANWDQPIAAKTVLIGEVSLAGDIRPVPRLELRAKEAKRLGYTHLIYPASSKLSPLAGMKLSPVKTLAQALEYAGLKPVHKAKTPPPPKAFLEP